MLCSDSNLKQLCLLETNSDVRNSVVVYCSSELCCSEIYEMKDFWLGHLIASAASTTGYTAVNIQRGNMQYSKLLCDTWMVIVISAVGMIF